MSIWHKSLMTAAVAGLVMLGCVADTASSAPGIIRANIAFEQVINLHKQSDVTFGGLQARPNDKVSMGSDGNMRLSGKGEILKPFGSPSVITLGDTQRHMLNFLTDNYTPGQGITSLKAHCTVKGSGDDCSSVPLFGAKQSTLLVGMDMTIGDGLLPPGSLAPPSFDMSVVYQ